MRDALDVALGRRRQSRERLRFGGAAHPARGVRDGDDASPRRRKRETGEQWGDVVALSASSALEHQTAAGERPRADGGTLRASRRARERGSVRGHAVDLRERAPDGEGELRPRSESRVRRQAAVHADPGAALHTVIGEKAPARLGRAIDVLPLDLQNVGGRRGHEQRRRRRRRADAAEPPPERAAKIEHAEVQARRGFDKDRLPRRLLGHERPGPRKQEHTSTHPMSFMTGTRQRAPDILK